MGFNRKTKQIICFLLFLASASGCEKLAIRGVELADAGTDSLVVTATNALQNFLAHILHITDAYDSGHLLIPRTGQIQVTLQSGKILVIGGGRGTSGEDVIETELIDPVNGTVTYAADAVVRRWGPTGTLLPSGKVLVCGGSNNAVGPLKSCEIYDPTANTWTLTANMAVNRSGHSATLLQSGLVLIAGGQDGPTYWDDAELFDPAGNAGAGSFAVTGAMPATLYNHQAIRLDTIGGKVLVATGFQSYLYNPTLGTWAATTGTQNFERNGQAMVKLANGKVLSASGDIPFIGRTKKCEVFDPATQLWTVTGDLTEARIGHSVTLLPNGKVLLAGGQAPGGTTSSAELYDPTAGTWSAAASMPTAVMYHSTTLLADGRVMSIGGGQTYGTTIDQFAYYTPASNTWSSGSPVNTIARKYHTATKLADGRVLFAGGQTPETEIAFVYNSFNITAMTQIYDPSDQTWTTLSSLNVARAYHLAILLNNGKILVAGGVDSGGNALTSAELFDPNTSTWTLLASTMTVARYFYSSATLLGNGTVLLAGGLDGTGTETNTTEIFNPVTSTFSAGPPMATARYGHSATLLNNGTILIAGGLANPNIATNTTEIYNAGVWSAGTPLIAARGLMTGTKVSNGDVVIAGGSDSGVGLNTIEVYHTNNTVTTLAGTLQYLTDFHEAVLLPNGKVLVTGGYDMSTYYVVDVAQEIDPVAGTVTGTAIFPRGGRIGHSMTLLDDGRVLIQGGEDSSYVYHDAEFYESAAAVAIQSSGCTAPYTYSLTSGTGTLYSSGLYVPNQVTAETAVVKVTSAGGCTEDFPITTQ